MQQLKSKYTTSSLFIFLLIFCSCAPKIYYQDGYSKSEIPAYNMSGVQDLHIESRYVGDALNYIVFEMDISNDSNLDIPISIADINLNIIDVENNQLSTIYPLNKDQLIEDLRLDQNNLKQEKKNNISFNFLELGLTALAIGLGGSTVEIINNAAYALEISSIIIEDNRSYALIEKDLEGQIEYIKEWVLDKDVIPPKSKISFDIIFPSTLINGEGTLSILNDMLNYDQEFVFEVAELKNR